LILDNSCLGIILNPTAGKGHASDIEHQLISCLRNKNISFKLEKTKSPGHATSIARDLSEEYDVIIAAGGDGTINEVAEGLVGTKSALAFISIGSGNDFNKMICFPKNIAQNIDSILNGKKKIIDYGIITYLNSAGQTKNRIFINTLGIGLDAEIACETKNIKHLRGLPLYFLAAAKALINHSPNEYMIRDGGTSKYEKAFFICIGNGSYEGGGFKILPDANPYDAYLDVCVIESMPLIKAVRYIPRLISGTHNNYDKSISLWRSKCMKVEALRPFIIHGDGEIIEKEATNLEVKIVEQGLTIIVPSQFY
jgi:diacylglycerol kinase (ATP)